MNTIRKPNTLDMTLLVLTGLIWAGAFSAIKIAVVETGPIWLATIRVTIGALVLAPYVIWRGLVLPRDAGTWIVIVLMTLFNVVFPFFLISWAELTIDAGVASILMGTGPFAALLGSHFFTDDDRITGPKLLAVLLGFSGIVLIIGVDAFAGLGRAGILAPIAALCGSLSYVVAGLLIRKIDVPPTRLAFLALSIAAIILFAIAIVTDGPLTSIPSSRASMALLVLGILPTGIAYILRFHLIRTVGYSTFAYSVNLVPVFGVILGAVLLDEPLRPQVLAALALIVAGLFIARAGSKSGSRSQS